VPCGTGDRNRVREEGAHAHPGFDPGRIGIGGGQSIVGAMIPVPSGVRVWLAVGHTDMRRGMNSLALLRQSPAKPCDFPQAGLVDPSHEISRSARAASAQGLNGAQICWIYLVNFLVNLFFNSGTFPVFL
jgi:hypothetical protein